MWLFLEQSLGFGELLFMDNFPETAEDGGGWGSQRCTSGGLCEGGGRAGGYWGEEYGEESMGEESMGEESREDCLKTRLQLPFKSVNS